MTTFEIITDTPPSLDELQEKVGGYVELMNLTDGGQLLFDEDGVMKQLPVNAEATDLAFRLGKVPTTIVGNAVHLTGDGRLTEEE